MHAAARPNNGRWQEGKCHFGPTCKYAHGDGDLRPDAGGGGGGGPPRAFGPRPGGGAGVVGKNVTIHKTKLCERFMATGQCPYGPKCTFAHGWVASPPRIFVLGVV
jgi:hypothetical protein